MKKYKIEDYKHSHMLAEMKPVYKTNVGSFKTTIIQNSKDIYKYVKLSFDDDIIDYTESMVLIMLNRKNRILGWVTISTGGTAGTLVDVKVIFALALQTAAQAIILCHNHPSGNLKPSRADHILTTKIEEGAKIFDIMLLDHLIITKDEYYSMADEGLIN